MAEMKKYLDTVALGALVDQIKAEDAKALAAAKKYTDDSVALCDVAGSAASALEDAKKYTDELAAGQVATNKADIAKLNGDVNTDGSVAKAVATAQTTLQAGIDAVDAKAVQNAADIDTLEGQVAALIEGTYDDTEVRGLISANAGAIEALGQTHATDKGALEGAIALKANQTALDAVSAVANAAVKQSDYDVKVAALEAEDARIEGLVTAEAERAAGIEAGLESRLAVVEGDYLKTADKEELQGNIDTLTGVVNTLSEGIDAEKVDGVKDLIAYVEEHGTEVTGMKEDIADNAEAIAGVAERMGAAEGKITTLEGAVATKAEKEYVDEQVEALQGVDAGFETRIASLEGKFGEGDGSVEDMIADAKQEAIDTAAGDATSKANAAEAAAKGHADSLNTAMNDRVVALEAIDHEHGNKDELDLIVSGDKAKWDAAAAIAHEHGNKGVLDGITADKVVAWDAAEGNAKTFAQGLNDAMDGKVNGIDARVTKNAEDIALKAAQTDLEAAVARIAKNETDIASVTSAVNSFTAITADEVNALFA